MGKPTTGTPEDQPKATGQDAEMAPNLLEMANIEEAELRVRVLRMQHQREVMLLEETEETQRARVQAKLQRSERNKQRQSDLATVRAQEAAIQKGCRHKQGGFRKKLYQGDGKPCITRFTMPDGVTDFLQCQRCGLKMYTPHPNLEQRNPVEYARQRALFDKLLELHEESGLDFIKGPTFTFTRFGVPFIPERVGISV